MSARIARTHRINRLIQWLDPPRRPSLSHRDVNLWRVALDDCQTHVTALKQTLTADEMQRADRFRFDQHRNRFIVGRGALRAILGPYLGAAPLSLRFDYNDHGKPRLHGQTGLEAIRFNLAHAGGLAVVAVARGRTVGVDMEQIIDRGNLQRIADRFFAPREAEAIRSLNEPARTEAFFNCWTRKEAYVKALGVGITLPLNCFEVSVLPGQPALLLRVYDRCDLRFRCSMSELHVAPGYAGALVVAGDDCATSYWQWHF